MIVIKKSLIDPQAALVRYSVTFVVPPLAGLLANFISRWLRAC